MKDTKNESLNARRERFKKLAEYRTNEVLKKINILGNCSNKSTYSYTDSEVNKIFSEIEKAVKQTKLKFQSRKKKKFQL